MRHFGNKVNTMPSSLSLCFNSFVMFSDDVDLNSVASIPGMGIPEQLKAAMEQEQSSKSLCQFYHSKNFFF